MDQNQHGKVIQRRRGAKNKLLEKGMTTPSSLVINLLTSIKQLFITAGKYTNEKAVSQVPDNRNY